MTTIAHFDGARVVVGIDTHKDEHVAVAIDRPGARLGEHRLRASPTGYAGLERWAIGMGDIVAFGVEGTGSFGAGLARTRYPGLNHTHLTELLAEREALVLGRSTVRRIFRYSKNGTRSVR